MIDRAVTLARADATALVLLALGGGRGTRLRIALLLLKYEEGTFEGLALALGCSPATARNHLEVLVRHGACHRRREAGRHYYCLCPGVAAIVGAAAALSEPERRNR